jgi:hypothetical protein
MQLYFQFSEDMHEATVGASYETLFSYELQSFKQ